MKLWFVLTPDKKVARWEAERLRIGDLAVGETEKEAIKAFIWPESGPLGIDWEIWEKRKRKGFTCVCLDVEFPE